MVHFALALTLSAVVLLTAARLWRTDSTAALVATVGTWNLCLGAVAALCALASGLGAVLDLDVSDAAHAAIGLHMKWAVFSALAILLLALWRGAGMAQDSRPPWLFLILLLAAGGALLVTGYHGGANVYRYGVGVQLGGGR